MPKPVSTHYTGNEIISIHTTCRSILIDHRDMIYTHNNYNSYEILYFLFSNFFILNLCLIFIDLLFPI